MANHVTPNPQDETYLRYLADQNGSGVGANLTPQGTHKTVDGVIAAYGAAGQDIPATLQAPINELRDLARSEAELAGASPEARRALSFGGVYDPLAVGRRERELIASITNGSRGVFLQPADLAASADRQTYAESQAGAIIAGQKVRENEQTLAMGDLQLESARLAAEVNDAANRGLAAETARAAAAQSLLDSLGNVSTFDMINALNADNPQVAQEVFGEGTTRDVQLQAMTLRLAQENAALAAQGAGTAVGAPLSESANAIAQMGALQMQRSSNIIDELGDGLAAVVSGEAPLPEGITLQEAQRAFTLQQSRQISQNQLAVDMMNGALDVEANKAETGFRIMSTLPISEITAIADAVAQGQPIELGIPGTDATLTLDPKQASDVLARIDAGFTAQAQQDALRSLTANVAKGFSQELRNVEQNIRAATGGNVPFIVQQALAAEKLAIADAAYGEGDVNALANSMSRIEQAMIDAGMSEDAISMAIHDRFPNDQVIGTGAANMLSRSPDKQLFTPVTNAFLSQLEARAASGGNPLTPDRLAEIRGILGDSEISGDEAASKLRTILGYPVQELRSMMQASLVGATFNAGFADFVNKLVSGPEQGGLGVMGSGEGQALMRDLQAAVREKLASGEPLDAEAYIGTVRALASAYTQTDADRDAMMGVFYDSLSAQSGGDLFRRADGSLPSTDELALFAMINNLSSQGPSSGKGSIPLSELPEVLGNALDDQIAQTVLGYQRVTTASPQQQALSYAVGQLLGIDTRDNPLGLVQIPSNDLNNPAGLVQGAAADPGNSVIVRSPDGAVAGGNLANTEQILDLNPRLTRLVANYVMPRIVMAAERPTSWLDFITLGSTIDTEEQAAMLSGIDFNELQRLAYDAGLLGGQ